jgi:predicted nuclease of restriction endonuclease-like (RecB) superfamily
VQLASGSWQHSETDLEAALDQHITDLLLDPGDDFAFVGRQKRLRIDETWFRIDFLFSIVDSVA